LRGAEAAPSPRPAQSRHAGLRGDGYHVTRCDGRYSTDVRYPPVLMDRPGPQQKARHITGIRALWRCRGSWPPAVLGGGGHEPGLDTAAPRGRCGLPVSGGGRESESGRPGPGYCQQGSAGAVSNLWRCPGTWSPARVKVTPDALAAVAAGVIPPPVVIESSRFLKGIIRYRLAQCP